MSKPDKQDICSNDGVGVINMTHRARLPCLRCPHPADCVHFARWGLVIEGSCRDAAWARADQRDFDEAIVAGEVLTNEER